MIQIIGFLICAMLAVKLLEMAAHPALHDPDHKGRDFIVGALWLGWLSVFGFAIWLLAQGGAFPAPEPVKAAVYDPLTPEQVDCVTNARGDKEIIAFPS